MTVAEMPAELKELTDVLVLARSVVSTTIRELEDGFQVKDLVPIIGDNVEKAVAAYEGSGAIADAFKLHPRQAISAIATLVVDIACDILKKGYPDTEPEESELKETKELIAAVSGLTVSIVEKLPGGFKATEIIPIAYDNFQSLITGIGGVSKIGAEFCGDVRAFLHMAIQAVIGIAFDVKEAIEQQG